MEPSARAFAAVRKLTRQALQDGWLEPCVDGLPVGTAGDVLTAHRAAWEQTDHWERLYGRRISEIVDQQERRLGPMNCETRYHCLYEPLVDAFWTEWEAKSGFST